MKRGKALALVMVVKLNNLMSTLSKVHCIGENRMVKDHSNYSGDSVRHSKQATRVV